MASLTPIDRLRIDLLERMASDPAVAYKNEELENKVDLVISSIVESPTLHSFEYIMDWIQRKRATREMCAEEISIKDTKDWLVAEDTGNIHHVTGKFFSVVGMKASSKYREVEGWCQPIIKQPEVGILGIVARKFDNVLHFLMQGKDEPGNIEGIQISPTLQATKSNYSRVHKGKLPLFFDLFDNPESGTGKILYKKLQAEEGGRFLQKHNLNIVIELGEDEKIDYHDNFIWMTLYQLKKLMQHEDIVNSCARSIIACLP